jgi:hypothetical protein
MIISIQDIKNELEEKRLESWMKLIRVLTHEIMIQLPNYFIDSLSGSIAGW